MFLHTQRSWSSVILIFYILFHFASLNVYIKVVKIFLSIKHDRGKVRKLISTDSYVVHYLMYEIGR